MSKLIYVSGGDYSSLQFENAFKGTNVSEIIENPLSYTLKEYNGAYESEYHDVFWKLSVLDVGEVDSQFISFVRNNVQDYDDSKSNNFWFDNESI